MEKLKTLVVGCGNMGISHARAYHQLEDFEIVGLVSRKPESRERLSQELGGCPPMPVLTRLWKRPTLRWFP